MRGAPAALVLAAALGCAWRGGPVLDPVTSDPATLDPAYPAAIEELSLTSHGGTMNGILYLAQGPGPHPTVVLLHGLPGNERNLDLAQALRRDGWNVLFFHYRGAWGSGGEFSFQNALDDVSAVLWTARGLEFAKAHRIDPRRIALVGHSMGGFLALITTSEDPAVDCAVSIAGADLGALGEGLAADPQRAAATGKLLARPGGPLHGMSGREAVAELIAHRRSWGLPARAQTLKGKNLLLVAGARDTDTPIELHHRPLFDALEAAGAPHVEQAVLPSDHAFSDARVALTRAVLAYLDKECR